MEAAFFLKFVVFGVSPQTTSTHFLMTFEKSGGCEYVVQRPDHEFIMILYQGSIKEKLEKSFFSQFLASHFRKDSNR
jgi:hypothetical protein